MDMTDLHERFRALDDIPAPYLWNEIERRAGQPASATSVGVLSPVRRQPRLATHSRSHAVQTTLKVATVAVIVLAVGLGLSLLQLPATSTLSPPPGGFPTPVPSPVMLPAGEELEAGATYFIDDAWGLGSLRLIVTVPAMGWFGAGSDLGKGVISATNNSVTVWLTPWRPQNLYVDSCHSRTQGLLDPALGPTVDDLATALVEQAVQPVAVVTDVTLGGHVGKRVELSLPPAST